MAATAGSSRSTRAGTPRRCSRPTRRDARAPLGPTWPTARSPSPRRSPPGPRLRPRSEDPLFHAIVDEPSGQAVGVASYLRIEPAVGVIEVGSIAYSPALQRPPAATEAMYLMMRRVFDELGYRRYEWKCDALNAPSRAAADRLGFRFEGIFRQATLYKGRNRDTAWYSIIDREWPAAEGGVRGLARPRQFHQRRSADPAAGALIAPEGGECCRKSCSSRWAWASTCKVRTSPRPPIARGARRDRPQLHARHPHAAAGR